jgi:hypothetical protein
MLSWIWGLGIAGLGWIGQSNWVALHCIGLNWIELDLTKDLDGMDRDDAKTYRRPHRTAFR